MKCTPTKIPDVKIFEPTVYSDERGSFCEIFQQNKFEELLGEKIIFCQENESFSQKNVIRGLHFQIPPFAQTKLVRVVQGEILDIAVDIRKDSPTYGEYISVVLSNANKKQLFIPQGFAHGFSVLSETAQVVYKVDNYYSPKHEKGILFSDETLKIDWKIDIEKRIVSEKDLELPLF